MTPAALARLLLALGAARAQALAAFEVSIAASRAARAPLAEAARHIAAGSPR